LITIGNVLVGLATGEFKSTDPMLDAFEISYNRIDIVRISTISPATVKVIFTVSPVAELTAAVDTVGLLSRQGIAQLYATRWLSSVELMQLAKNSVSTETRRRSRVCMADIPDVVSLYVIHDLMECVVTTSEPKCKKRRMGMQAAYIAEYRSQILYGHAVSPISPTGSNQRSAAGWRGR